MNVTYKGVTRSTSEWARLCGVSESTMRWRLHEWGIDRAVTTHGSKLKGKRKPYRKRGLSIVQRLTIIRMYREGESEDKIAQAVNRSRKTISAYLIRSGLKQKGKAPRRLV